MFRMAIAGVVLSVIGVVAWNVKSVYDERDALQERVDNLRHELVLMTETANLNAEALDEAELRFVVEKAALRREHQQELERTQLLATITSETDNVRPEDDAPIAPIVRDVLDRLYQHPVRTPGGPTG